MTVERLGEIFRELIRQGAHNINLVTPGHFAPWVAGPGAGAAGAGGVQHRRL